MKKGVGALARVITVTNQKGGVGKTTTTLAVGAGLMKKGFRVLVVDLDPQANLSFSLGGDMEEAPTVYELLKREIRPQYAVQRGNGVDFITSNILLSGAELEFTQLGREFLLKRMLLPLMGKYDYIIIDTPPALGFLTVNAFACADYVIIPMLADIFSLQGIAQLSDTIERMRAYCNSQIEVGGILLCKYDGRKVLSKRILETATMVAEQIGTKVYRCKIRNSIAIPESQTNQTSIFEYARSSEAARDYMSFVAELLEEGI
ncbi:ParA family protein [Oscillospiraceae bacterium MB08-C2-2]|nr:ParA family protein [Oscillospiraceae bacterium MB08-C2-2]